MKLIVDASVLGAPQSGVAVYLSQVLRGLPADIGVELRGVASRQTRRATDASRGQARRWLRKVPGAYWARQARLGMPAVEAGAVYWGANFTLPPWPLLRGPSVITVHDLVFVERPEWADATRGRYLRTALADSAKRASAIVCSSDDVRHRLGHPAKTFVIAPGIRRLQTDRPAIIEDAFVVAGNLEPRKDPFTALRAHRALPAELRRKHPLLFVGNALDEAYAARLATALDPPCSRWLGRLDDDALTALYGSAHAVIAPALAEGFGFVPLEAYVAGAPVFARELAITRETMGDRASYFREVADLVQLMMETTAPPSATERQSLAAKYTWQKTAAAYAALFRKCAGEDARDHHPVAEEAP